MATKTWAGGTSLFSTGTWSPVGTPVTGDNLVFDATSTTSMTLDTALTFGTISINTGYSGTVTLGASIGSGDVTLSAGTLTGNISYTWTCSGNFTHNATNTLTAAVLSLTMTGSSKTLTMATGNTIYNLRISGDTAAVRGGGNPIQLYHNLTVDAGKTLTIGAATTIQYQTYNSGAFINSGVIDGAGITFYQYNVAPSISVGVIMAPVTITLDSGAPASLTFTLKENMVLGSTLTISSGHASNTMTLDASTSNYPLSAAGITVGTRGILLGRGSKITCSGSFDPHLGTWTPATSQVVMTGIGTITLAAGQTFYDLVDRGITTLGANATISNMYAHVSPMRKGAFTLTISKPTLEYTGLRRPLVINLKKAAIPNPAARSLLENLERAS